MWSLVLRFLLTSFIHTSHATQLTADRHEARSILPHNSAQDYSIADTYDFVIAGGGVAGLVLANRLSLDSNTSVLVLEAGDTGDDVASSINVPANAYFATLLGTDYDWKYQTVPQPHAAGNSLTWPRGKVLGGSSAINGMYLVRPSQFEVDAWAGMISSQDNISAASWNWDSMFAAMKKSETFTAPSDSIKAAGAIEFDTSSHGTSGPLHYSYPGYMLPVVGDWSPTLQAVGIIPNPDASSGKTWGSFIATSSINPSNWTRSYARSAYLDPLPPRSNLVVLTNATVTRLIFAGNSSLGNLTATQVEYGAAGAPTKTVKVGKEVILAGGVVGSPQILMLSGVGPKDVLDSAGVSVNLDLPGVGHHLQDHLASQVVWSTSSDTDASLYNSKFHDAPPDSSSPFLSFINSATAYVNISTLLGPDAVADFQTQITNALASSVSSIAPSKDPTVLEGYQAIYNVTANQILTSSVGQVELLLSLTGTPQGGDQSITIQAALQHPFSQGQIYITSADPFDHPAINPNYLSHFADTVILREGLKLARKIGQTAPLSKSMGQEIFPGSLVSSDDDWDQFLSSHVSTEYHPSCTCAMLPRSQGGVVDAHLRVYGLANVRVADSSVYPIEFSAHLQALTYGLAEQAAEIILAQYNAVSPPSSSTSQPSSTTSQTRNSSAATSLHFTFSGVAATCSAIFVAIARTVLV